MKINRMIMILSAIILLLIPSNVSAKDSPLSHLDILSDQALQLTKAGRYEEATQQLKQFSEDFTEASVSGTFSMDELRILTVAHDQAMRSLDNSGLTQEQKINSVTTFRLVMDALSSQYQPLWVEMKHSILTSFEQVQLAADDKNSEKFQETFHQFLTKYSIIQPSIKLDRPVSSVQQIDARVDYIDKYQRMISQGQNTEELALLETDLENLFNGSTEDEADPSLWWVIISTGGIIISTLSYVGWRKYKGEAEKKSERLKH